MKAFSFIEIFLLVAASLVNNLAVGSRDEATYEAVDDICSECHCSEINGTAYAAEAQENAEVTSYFQLDCSLKSFKHLLAGWPDQLGTNHSGKEIVFILSANEIDHLQQLPETDAVLLFTCRHCKIKEIVSGVFIDTPNIIKVDLSWNSIDTDNLHADIFRGRFDDSAYEPLKIDSLDLSHNSINGFESNTFEHLPHIRVLLLGSNPIDNINEATKHAIGTLAKLEILDLSHTGLGNLPGGMFENLVGLSELFLQGNQFKKVPGSLSMLSQSLQYLHLNDNPIQTINAASFAGLQHLHQLNISGLWDLTEIQEGSMKPLNSLEILYCHNNKKLSNFSMEDLRELHHLKELHLSFNALTTLDFGLDITEELELIHKDNKTANLEEEDARYTNQFGKLRVLKLEGNPWHCDCNLFKGLSLFDHHAHYFIQSVNNDEARCKTPYDLSSKILYELPMNYICVTMANKKAPRIPVYDPPQFLRPKTILLSILSVCTVVVFGMIIGFAIVCVKRRLRKNDDGYNTPIRYTSVRESSTQIVNNPYNPT